MGRVNTMRDLEELGFKVLHEEVNELLIIGLIGQFWKPKGHFVDLDSNDFRGFDKPGFVKATASFRLHDRGGTTHLTTETLIGATDPSAERSFRRYWRLIGPFSGLVRRDWLRSVKRLAEAG